MEQNELQVAPVEMISLVTASECMEINTTDGLKPSKMTE